MKKKPTSPPLPLAKPAAKQPKPALSGIVERSPADLKPWPTNPRTHGDKQLTKLIASIRTFGFTIPALVDEDGVLLSGHAAVQAAFKLHLQSIPTRVISGLTEAMKRAYVIADNKLALLSSWDLSLLNAEIDAAARVRLRESRPPAFPPPRSNLMFTRTPGDPGDLQEQDIVEAVVTRLGDLWQLGGHRLLCGNALEASAYDAVLAGAKAQMCINRPALQRPDRWPCLWQRQGQAQGVRDGVGARCHPANSPASCKAPSPTCIPPSSMAPSSTPSWTGAMARSWQAAAEPVFGPPRQLCVWVKDKRRDGTFYRSQHELVYVFKKGDAPHINNFELGQHGRYRTNVWTTRAPTVARGVSCWHCILRSSRQPDRRRDPGLQPPKGNHPGSLRRHGTVLVAAERTGRHARAIELDPQYVDVAIQRWQRLTGKQAILAATGQTWEALRAERERAPALAMESDDDR